MLGQPIAVYYNWLKLLFFFSSAEKEQGHPPDRVVKIYNGPNFWTFFVHYLVFSVLLFGFYNIIFNLKVLPVLPPHSLLTICSDTT